MRQRWEQDFPPYVLFEFCVINSKGFKNEEWHHHLTGYLRTDTVPGTSSSREGVTLCPTAEQSDLRHYTELILQVSVLITGSQ